MQDYNLNLKIFFCKCLLRNDDHFALYSKCSFITNRSSLREVCPFSDYTWFSLWLNANFLTHEQVELFREHILKRRKPP